MACQERRRERGHLWSGLGAVCVLACLNGSPARADDWRCPVFIRDNGVGNNPVIMSAAGCMTTYVVTGSILLAPDVDQIIMSVKPTGSQMTLEPINSILGDAVTATALNHNTRYRVIFKWTPMLHDARAEPYKLQFEGPKNLNCTMEQFSVQVDKCKYCISNQDSLNTVAATLGTHWTQIWSSNPGIVSPDYVAMGTMISLGNMYKTRFGDTWKSIAVRFGTEYAMIKKLNPDIDFTISGAVTRETYDIPPETLVCIMPETCPIRRTPFPGITW